MEEGACVRTLVKLIFSKQFKNTAEVTAPDLSIPSSLETNDFLQRLQGVLCMKHIIFSNDWRKYTSACTETMLVSHYEYLKCVMFACLNECKCYQNVYESFVSVCALLNLFNDEILATTAMDFRDLNTDVLMVLYNHIMKNAFGQQGGYQQLVKYIHAHMYLSWEWNWKDLDSTDDPASAINQEDIKKAFGEEGSKRDITGIGSHFAEMNDASIFFAGLVLASTSIELPNLTNTPAKIKCLETSKNEGMAGESEKEGIKEDTAEFVDLNVASQESSDSKTDYTINQNCDNTKYESIIDAVIRHNRSKSSDHTNLDNQNQQKADEFSEHLIDTIESLKRVLDDYEKE